MGGPQVEEGQSAITIGTHNVQIVVNINVSERKLERWLKEMQTTTQWVKVEAFEEIEGLGQITKNVLPLFSNEQYPPQQALEARSGLVIRGTVEHTP